MTKTLPLRRTTCAPGFDFSDLKDRRTFMAPTFLSRTPPGVPTTPTIRRHGAFPGGDQRDIGLSGPFPASYDHEL
ncbi:hypothetical protein GCM10023194_34300 [Planotetraspora phitsanulokensis]|uniref:Uncharacterized protein n=1 Tax=Planotetraspora phitsanulokensis TaxID=575192 RepID=A0A8J3XDE7_9ACTN|nr:hypothetical protein Pph01_14440 [Planotetraspora phitsanulokensis]